MTSRPRPGLDFLAVSAAAVLVALSSLENVLLLLLSSGVCAALFGLDLAERHAGLVSAIAVALNLGLFALACGGAWWLTRRTPEPRRRALRLGAAWCYAGTAVAAMLLGGLANPRWG
jgi:hypothetical protein